MALEHRISLNIDTIRIHHWTECAAYCVKSPQQHRARGQLRWAILRRPVSIDPFRGPRGRITRFNEMTSVSLIRYSVVCSSRITAGIYHSIDSVDENKCIYYTL
jgi:hypothetical protein